MYSFFFGRRRIDLIELKMRNALLAACIESWASGSKPQCDPGTSRIYIYMILHSFSSTIVYTHSVIFFSYFTYSFRNPLNHNRRSPCIQGERPVVVHSQPNRFNVFVRRYYMRLCSRSYITCLYLHTYTSR